MALPALDLMRLIAEEGLAAITPTNATGRTRLGTAIEFCDFY